MCRFTAPTRLHCLVVIALLPSCNHVGKRELATTADPDSAPTAITVEPDSISSTSAVETPTPISLVAASRPPSGGRESLRSLLGTTVTEFEENEPAPPPPHDSNSDIGTEALIDSPRPSVGWTLAQFEQLAIDNNPTLQQVGWSLDKASGIREQVGLYPNPLIGYQGEEIGDAGTAGKQGAFVQQTIVLGDKLRLNRNVVDQDVQRLAWVNEAQRLRVLNDLKVSFFEAIGAQRRVKLAGDLEDVAAKGVKTAKELFEAKQGARPDILQAEIQLNEVRIIRRNAQFEFDNAWKRLTSIISRPDMVPVTLEGELRTEGPELTFNTVYEQLVTSSPEVQTAYASVERARANLSRQQAQPIPNLITQLGVAHDNATGDQIANIQVGIPLPTFNRNQGNIAAANAEYHRAWKDVERLRLSLRARLSTAFREYRQALNEVRSIETEILPRAKENRELTEQAYQLGEFDFLRVLTARRTYFESNLRYIRALTDLRNAVVRIEGLLLTGGLDAPADFDTGSTGLRGQALSGQ